MKAIPPPLTEAELAKTAINWRNLIWVALALVATTVVIIVNDAWFLNFVHVFAGLLWTGIDLLLGFVIGPILRRLDFPIRRAVTMQLMPRLLFILPTLAVIAPTAGWFMAVDQGYLGLVFPELWWLIGALAITMVLSIQGVFVLLPTNVMVYLEMRKPDPNGERIGRLMRRYVRVVAFQGSMQIVIILIMSRFATGL